MYRLLVVVLILAGAATVYIAVPKEEPIQNTYDFNASVVETDPNKIVFYKMDPPESAKLKEKFTSEELECALDIKCNPPVDLNGFTNLESTKSEEYHPHEESFKNHDEPINEAQELNESNPTEEITQPEILDNDPIKDMIGELNNISIQS